MKNCPEISTSERNTSLFFFLSIILLRTHRKGSNFNEIEIDEKYIPRYRFVLESFSRVILLFEDQKLF